MDTAREARDLLAALVGTPSLSGQETAVADVLSAWFERRGLGVHRIDDNLWVSVGSGDDVLLLNSHLDVVPPSEGHPYPPFEPTVKDGALFGRGAVDAKASVAAMAVTVAGLAAAGFDQPGGRVVAAFTACEETGWPYNGLDAIRPQLPAPTSAIVGEPTSLRPCIAQKGLLILKLTAKGISAHAARPERGENAVMKMAHDLARLERLSLDRVHPVLGRITVTATMIEGGTARNAIPDRCTAWVDVRSTPAYTHHELLDAVSETVLSDVSVHSDRLIPVDTAPEARIVRAAVAATEASPFGSPTLSDWIFLRDLEVVKLGPGESRLSHTANEHMPLDELARGVDVYRSTIHHYFEGVA